MSVKTFVKKPVEIQTIQFKDYSSAIEIFTWTEGKVFYVPAGFDHHMRYSTEKDRSTTHTRDSASAFLVIYTLEGIMRADLGDWIIRGVKGEFYPCKPDIFEETYDPVE